MREAWEGLEKGDGGDRVHPEVVCRQRGRSGVAGEDVVSGVATKSALRAESGSRSADLHKIVVQAMTFANAELGKRRPLRARQERLRRRQVRAGAGENAAGATACDDSRDSVCVDGF